MASLVTYSQAIEHLRVPYDESPDDVQAKLDQAEAMVLFYVDRTADSFLGSPVSTGDDQRLLIVRAAILITLEYLVRNTGGEEIDWRAYTDEQRWSFLPPNVAMMLSYLKPRVMA